MSKIRSISPLFWAVVVLPTILATVYFAFLAEDIYTSESRIIVRSPSKPDVSPLGAVLGSGSIAAASEESEAVREFLQSREALAQIDKDDFVRNAYGSPALSIFDRFGGLSGDSSEQLYEYFSEKLAIEDGTSAQVMRLRVEAFDPAHAQTINKRLLERAEVLVNTLSARARADAISFSNEEVSEARDNARSASLALARFRDQAGVIDPEMQAKVALQNISQLQEELIATRTQLLQMRTYTPRASQIPFLRTQVRELESEIAKQTRSIAGGSRSLSADAARYQELNLASQFAEKQLAVALASQQDAQAEARRKQAYVDRISDASLPDYAAYPRRLRGVLATLLLGLLAWGILSMLLVGIREHRD
ncbi:Wzz/FepE/Etk N-terminal domain-containing protein [Pontixanthobacter aquaemixtae]|uniref:Wzz/FepE/Etk N-terminal domain-containing protein n=1 Tax=Pontixanthobacter aquaemixtae TaxID=1958940 RepID=UPI001F1EC079